MKKHLIQMLLLLLISGWSLVVGYGQDQKEAGANNHTARFIVASYEARVPIADATIRNGQGQVLGTTNETGVAILKVPMSAREQYTIQATGYEDISMRLKQADRTTADYEVFMQKGEHPKMTKKQTSTNMAATPPVEEEMVKVYVRQDPEEIVQNNPPAEDVLFAVQLSATSRPISDKNTLKSWEELGPVFVHREEKLYKVRIGPFTTQEAAKDVLLKVKARGKKDAFIVVQQGRDQHDDLSPVRNDSPEPAVVTTPTPVPPPTPKHSAVADVAAETGDYKVRLASYLQPGGFNTKEIDQYGPLESYRKGEWTIFMIGGFKTKADAVKVKEAVIAKGYKDAVVVKDEGGVLITEKD